MRKYLIRPLKEESLFTGVNEDGLWLVYWLRVSGISEIRDLSFDTNIFLDQIVKAKNKSREGIVAHFFDSEGNLINTSFNLHEKGLDIMNVRRLIKDFTEGLAIKSQPIEVKAFDLIHKKVRFSINETESGVYTLEPRCLSWLDGEHFIEAVG